MGDQSGLAFHSRDREITFENSRDDGKLVVRIRKANKTVGTALSEAHEEALRRFLNERHANRS